VRSDKPRLAANVILLAVFVVAILMRAYGLNGRFDYDGYDEGVYWQTLRAMSHGYHLYKDIFCSQPPAFPLSIYPFYILFGSTILAARIGVAGISLLGLVGAYLLGRALAGRLGGVAALVLVVAAPSYLRASQTLQAEGPSTAFLLLATGAAFTWREHSTGLKGLALAALCGGALLLGILSKLLDVTATVLVVALIIERLWLIRQQAGSRVGMILWPIAGAAIATTIAGVIILAPFLRTLPSFVQQIMTFHFAARKLATAWWTNNAHAMLQFTLANSALIAAALIGLAVAISRRDRRVIPIIAWFAATCVILLVQAPLFARHIIVLVPPLIAIAVLGVSVPSSAQHGRRINWIPRQSGNLLTSLCIFIAVISGALSESTYYHALAIRAKSNDAQLGARIADDMQRATAPGQWVITDAQFIAGLADGDTPPWLVDTSSVRIDSGYLTVRELIKAASDARVHVVLFATGRLSSAPLTRFRSWVAQHYQPYGEYGAGIELWRR
jgi:4-amino-4-deoxy-L-arabinose transferase-like glycosyltransferase